MWALRSLSNYYCLFSANLETLFFLAISNFPREMEIPSKDEVLKLALNSQTSHQLVQLYQKKPYLHI